MAAAYPGDPTLMDPTGPTLSSPYYLGIDLGTSGVRACVIDQTGAIVTQQQRPLPEPIASGPGRAQDALLWWTAVVALIGEIERHVDLSQISALAIDGTSGTVLLTDSLNHPLTPALMYHDARANSQTKNIAALAPADSPARSVSGGLAKILWLLEQTADNAVANIAHQADWIAAQFTRQPGHSDVINCLKTGYDPLNHRWPEWLNALSFPRKYLPVVHQPGEKIAKIDPQVARQLGFAENTLIIAGTTDSHAAAIASGIQEPGDAVTSLGSTLVLKIVSDRPIFDAASGIYSQPFGKYWLVGGASNSGGAVLKHFFTIEQMQTLTSQLDPQHLTGLTYYPLLQPGERFPIDDPNLAPQLMPRPENDTEFFQGMLEGIARIEQQGYQRLTELGAPRPTSIRTVGGGACNQAWTAIRESILKLPITTPLNSEAAYGTALLAKNLPRVMTDHF